MGSVIKMIGSGTGGDESAIATVDVPAPGHIIGVEWAGGAALDADGDVCLVQLSFRSALSFTSNDDRGLISEVRLRAELVTSGLIVPSHNGYTQLPELPVMGGERLYMHVSATASTPSTWVAMVHFDFDMDKVSMRRR